MAKRRFELPGIQDLSKEQEAARALPKEGQHLIVGGPGTGKSVLALIRTRRHQRAGDDYLFLVFNHLLNRANGELFGEGLKSETWIGWFHKMFKETTGKPAPLMPPRSGSDFRGIDWDGVDTIIQSLPASAPHIERPYLVIDEGQDMPRQFYESLVNLGFEDFFVVADQNQQIKEENSSRRDIENCLGLNTADVKELTWNYRNRYAVARLAREFYTGDPASPPPDLPGPAPLAGAAPWLYSYHPDHLSAVARRILSLSDRGPRQLIGVIAPNNRVRERYLSALQSVDIPLDNPRPTIEHFPRRPPPRHRLRRGRHPGHQRAGLQGSRVRYGDACRHRRALDQPAGSGRRQTPVLRHGRAGHRARVPVHETGRTLH